MSIASQETVVDDNNFREYALATHHAGFNVVPMKSESKAPALPTWKEYTKRAQTEEEVLSFPWQGPNIGIVNGIIGVRTIDIDQCDNIDTVFHILQLLGLEFEYQWVVHSPGKGGGFHIYILCPDALTLTSTGVLVGDPHEGQTFKQIELRWANCVTMFPPSIHPDAKEPYEWVYNTPTELIATVPVALVEKAFLAIATPQKKEKQPAKTLAPAKMPKYDAWAEKALNQEVAAVRSTGEGQRNAQLNKSAFNLGQIVGAGLLSEKDVEEELTQIAQTIDLNDKEITATVKSGLDAGKKKPRMPKQVYRDNEPPFKLQPAQKVDDEKIASFSPDDQGHAEAVHA